MLSVVVSAAVSLVGIETKRCIESYLESPIVNKSSAAAEMGDRYAVINVGRKVGSVVLS